MTEKTIVHFWRRQKVALLRWPAPALADVAIPSAAKRFLRRVGLPRYEGGWTIRFRVYADGVPRVPGKPEYRVIGYDDTEQDPICLDEANGGRVLDVETEGERREWFMNSTVQQLARCLVVREQFYLRAGDAERAGGTDAVDALADVTERRLRRLDSVAFDRRHRFLVWPNLMDYMRCGM